VGLGNASGYSASKFALVGWSEGLRFELEPRGVYVSLVEPGPIPTEGFPQSDLKGHVLLRFALGTTKDVSKAVFDAIEGRRMQRVVPRAYYFAQLPRILAPRLFRLAMRKIVNRRA
jgi:short-subunit dehydrogenase